MTSLITPSPISSTRLTGQKGSMSFQTTAIAGAFTIDPVRREDARGSFARLWSVKELLLHGLAADFPEVNTSTSRKRGTIRGLHFQLPPFEEAKIVRCVRGAIYDVILDLRPGSSTRNQWAGFELRAGTDRMLYVPPGCAHGVQALEDDSEIIYAVSACYTPSTERGVRWNDPAFGIHWPIAIPILSDKDAAWPDFSSQ